MTENNDAIQYGRVAYSTLDAMREAAPERETANVERVMDEVHAIMQEIQNDD